MGCQDRGLPRNSQGASLVYTVIPHINSPVSDMVENENQPEGVIWPPHLICGTHNHSHTCKCMHTYTHMHTCSLPPFLSLQKLKRNKAIHSLLARVQLMIYGYDEGAHLVPIAVCILPGNFEMWLRLYLILSFVTGVCTLCIVKGVTVDSVYPQDWGNYTKKFLPILRMALWKILIESVL